MEIVGFRVGHTWIEFGSDETLHSWFLTIAKKLEYQKWGSRFPLIMNRFFYLKSNRIDYTEAKMFHHELMQIKDEFVHLKLSDVVWTQNNKQVAIPTNATNINNNAVNLSEFYISNYNQNLFLLLEKIVTDILPHEKASCFIETKYDFMVGINSL